MKQVLIKAYGWCEIIQHHGSYAEIKTPKGGHIVYNISGHEIRDIEPPKKQEVKQGKLF
jgi:hypothetical protein